MIHGSPSQITSGTARVSMKPHAFQWEVLAADKRRTRKPLPLSIRLSRPRPYDKNHFLGWKSYQSHFEVYLKHVIPWFYSVCVSTVLIVIQAPPLDSARPLQELPASKDHRDTPRGQLFRQLAAQPGSSSCGLIPTSWLKPTDRI